jgi:PleD family two-component response regulator
MIWESGGKSNEWGTDHRPQVSGEGRRSMDTLKILVVDDEPSMRKRVRDFLVRKNYEVVEAAD